MFQILFLFQRIAQENIGACKPGVAGIFGCCLPVFLIDSGSHGFWNDSVFFREIVVIFGIGVILFQSAVGCFDNKFYFFFFACKIELFISIGKFLWKSAWEC